MILARLCRRDKDGFISATLVGLVIALRALAEFDSSSWLSEAGAAVVTGPTGHNLRDLRILLADSAD